MPQRIEFEGAVHEFPDDFTDQDIAAALSRERSPKAATPPPPSATIGMLAPSTAQGDPKQRTGADDIRDTLQWGGKVLAGMMGMNAPGIISPGINAVENPTTTLATGAIPIAVQAAAGKVPGVIEAGRRMAGISKARAGQNIEAALHAGSDLTVPLNQGANDAALRARELVGSKNSELNAFLDRLTNPKVTQYRGDDLAVREAQDFVSKFGAMSADDALKLPAVAKKEFTKLAAELRSALTGTLDTVGSGEQYARGVSEYRRANQVADIWERAQPLLRRLGYAAAAGAGYKGLNAGASR